MTSIPPYPPFIWEIGDIYIEILYRINTVLCPIKGNSNTIEIILHTSVRVAECFFTTFTARGSCTGPLTVGPTIRLISLFYSLMIPPLIKERMIVEEVKPYLY